MRAVREENYWPGFVDALSNVVLTLVFVLVVFVFALVLASNKVEQQMHEKIKAAYAETDPNSFKSKIIELEVELQKTKKKLAEIKVHPPSVSGAIEHEVKIDVDGLADLHAKGSVVVLRKKGKLIIVFPTALSDLDDDSLAVLDKELEVMRQSISGKNLVFNSYIGKESYSAAKRLAYYRILGLRNYLQKKSKYKWKKITQHILKQDKAQNGRVEIIFN